MPMDKSTALVTVRVVEPETAPRVAEIVAEPTPGLSATPSLPGALLILATVASDEAQVTLVVRFWVVESVNTPVAVNDCWKPLATEGLVGVTPMETRVALETFRSAAPVLPLRLALMTVEP